MSSFPNSEYHSSSWLPKVTVQGISKLSIRAHKKLSGFAVICRTRLNGHGMHHIAGNDYQIGFGVIDKLGYCGHGLSVLAYAHESAAYVCVGKLQYPEILLSVFGKSVIAKTVDIGRQTVVLNLALLKGVLHIHIKADCARKRKRAAYKKYRSDYYGQNAYKFFSVKLLFHEPCPSFCRVFRNKLSA